MCQVCGTPLDLSEEERLEAFRKGWGHSFRGQPTPGYYIGRHHPPYTRCEVVKHMRAGEGEGGEGGGGDGRGGEGEGGEEGEDLVGFSLAAEGEPGLLITRGNNLMSGYVGDEEGSREAVVGGWYLKLGDVVFWLEGTGGGRDLYWCTRESALLIRGGANYSYEQISAEIARFVSAEYGLASGQVEVGVVGLRISSEHEDECCVTLELISEEARAKRALIEESFLATARRNVSKGARPDRVRFAALPRNFKGALQHPLLKEQWKAALEQSS